MYLLFILCISFMHKHIEHSQFCKFVVRINIDCTFQSHSLQPFKSTVFANISNNSDSKCQYIDCNKSNKDKGRTGKDVG